MKQDLRRMQKERRRSPGGACKQEKVSFWKCKQEKVSCLEANFEQIDEASTHAAALLPRSLYPQATSPPPTADGNLDKRALRSAILLG